MAAIRSADICSSCDGNCSALESGCQNVSDHSKCAQNNAPRHPDPLCLGGAGEALGIGSDWLHEPLSAEQRVAVSHMISSQILNVYAQGLSLSFTSSYWFRSQDNFNSVCNGGVALAALAVLDEGNGQTYGDTTKFARDALQAALLALPHGAASTMPDGSCPEGPGYGGT